MKNYVTVKGLVSVLSNEKRCLTYTAAVHQGAIWLFLLCFWGFFYICHFSIQSVVFNSSIQFLELITINRTHCLLAKVNCYYQMFFLKSTKNRDSER